MGERKTSAGQVEQAEKAISLVRVSTVQQALEDRGGIPAQREAIERIARQRNLYVPPGWNFEIAGVSGCAVSVTPTMAQILRIIRSGECRALILKEESRLMRPDNMEDYGILQQFIKHNVKIHLPDSVFDLRNPSDMLHALIRFGFSGYERKLIRDRMLSGKLAKRQAGEWVYGANAPYGMKVVEKNKQKLLAVDEATIGHVKRLFKLRLAGVASRTELIRQVPGIKYSNILYLLRNETYTGYFVAKMKADPDGLVRHPDGTIKCQKRVALPEDQWERFWVMGDAEAPISVADYKAVQRLLDISTRQRIRHTKEREYNFLYRGLLRCGECGRNVRSIRYGNPQVKFHCGYYLCHGGSRLHHPGDKTVACASRRMRRDVLEPMLDGMISKYFSDPGFFTKLVEQQELALSRREERAVEIDRLQREVKSAEEAIQVTVKLLQRQRISDAEFDRDHDQFTREKQAAEKALREMQPDVDTIPAEAWAHFALRFKRWSKLSFKDRRALLTSVAPIFRVAAYREPEQRRPRIVITDCTVSLTGQQIDLPNESDNRTEMEDDSSLATYSRHSYMSALSSQYSISIPLNSLQA